MTGKRDKQEIMSTVKHRAHVETETHFKHDGSGSGEIEAYPVEVYEEGRYNSIEEGIAIRYAEIMTLLGITETEDNYETPARVALALMDMTEGLRKSEDELLRICTVFPNKNRGAVMLRQENIEFSSICSHHHLPFIGNVNIYYVPNEKIIGLSKFKRVVDFFASRPQVQEELCAEIGKFLGDLLNPFELTVEITNTWHTCMCSRGVHSRSTTSTLYTYQPE